MSMIPLPENPNLEQLRHRARDLQRAVRAGEPGVLERLGLDRPAPDYRLGAAQLAVARGHGFVSWARLRRHVEAINSRSWTPGSADGSPLTAFIRLAFVTYAGGDVDSSAQPGRSALAAGLLAEHPDLPGRNLAAAAATADVQAVRQHLSRRPGAARQACAPFGWAPLMYVTYSRLEAAAPEVIATVRLLLEVGADPNDGRFFAGLPTPFTVLTGAFGGGEGDQVSHRHGIAVARELLSAGADPNDGQTLYNRMFSSDDDFLELLFEFGLGRGDGGPWRALLPDLIPAPQVLVRRLLDWAIVHDQRARVALLARHGVDVAGPLPSGPTPRQSALSNGHRELDELLRSFGAPTPALDPVDAFVAATMGGDTAVITATAPEVIAAARAARPALIVWATGQERCDAVDALVVAGFDIDALGRSDLPVNQPWQTALHTAVERGNLKLVRRLLELGADPAIRDRRFDGTPADWAEHLGELKISALLRTIR